MVDLFDRENERKQINNILENESLKDSFVVWIEGIEGAGKTQFLKYLIDKTKVFVFDFADFERIYKCEKINMHNEFAYISTIVFKILKDHPHKFQVFLQDYFDDQNRITFLDAGCLILPQLKVFAPIKKLFETKYEFITHSQGNVTDKLINTQLVDFFSDIIIYYLTTIKNGIEHFMFCIDDLQWIDNSSLKTINSILAKVSHCYPNLNVSLSITIRDAKSLSPEERVNYNSAYKVLENHYDNIHTIVMNNFDLHITKQLIHSKKRYFLEENIQKIYQITNGNPMELIQTLRFSDDEVKRIIDSDSYRLNTTLNNKRFSQEMIVSLYRENEYFIYILNTLSIVGCYLSRNMLIKIINFLSKVIYHKMSTRMHINNAIELLINRDILNEGIDGVSISHDSMKSLITDYLKSTGEYSQYVFVISDVFLSENEVNFSKQKSNIYFALKLLKDVDPQKGFNTFVDILHNPAINVTGEVYEIGAECFCLDISNFNITTINDVVVCEILPSLFESGKLKIAKKISEYIYDFKNELEPEMHIRYLFYYIRTLVEMGILDAKTSPISAITLFDELQNIDISDKDILLQTKLLGMSIYEHLLEFNKIKQLYASANEIVNSTSNISSLTLSRFYRNKGLVGSHKSLVSDYILAYKYSCNMEYGAKRQIMRGTTLNNLGLSYFYSGQISKALLCFKASLKTLQGIGCEVSRIFNNISICHFMLGEVEEAYSFISEALSYRIEGKFINTCMQTNYALILNALEETKQATDILDSLIDEYYLCNDKCQDEVAYSAALLNRAYIHMQYAEYLDAIKLLKESAKQVYRFEHSLQQKKRMEMINYCLHQENLIADISINIDFEDNTNDIYSKPYSLMPFAYYVI